MLKKLYNFILDLLLPQYCLGCHKNGESICEDCLWKAIRNTENLGEDTFAVYSYHDPVIKEAIKALKYKGAKVISVSLAKALYEASLEIISEEIELENKLLKQKILVIPVPLHRTRLQKRGFNQSEEIAKKICELDENRTLEINTKVLERTKETPSQVSVVNREKRLSNLRDAFSIKNKDEINGKTILLIDDVITTGATMDSCRKKLLKAGAKKVIAFSVAH